MTDVDKDKALRKAANYGYYSDMETLLEQGADANSRNPYDETALHLAVSYGCPKCVKLLLRHGADIYAGDEDEEVEHRETPLRLAKEYHKEMYRILRDYKPTKILDNHLF